MEIRIREAVASDALILAALAGATFYETYVETDDPQDLAEYVTTKFSVEATERELDDPSATFLIAEADGKAVGYARFLRGEPPEFLSGIRSAEIQRIYLLSKFGRKGIGSALIDECLRRAEFEGYEAVFLGVWNENLSAKAFYESRGFRLAGEVEFSYGKSTFTNEVMMRSL